MRILIISESWKESYKLIFFIKQWLTFSYNVWWSRNHDLFNEARYFFLIKQIFSFMKQNSKSWTLYISYINWSHLLITFCKPVSRHNILFHDKISYYFQISNFLLLILVWLFFFKQLEIITIKCFIYKNQYYLKSIYRDNCS